MIMVISGCICIFHEPIMMSMYFLDYLKMYLYSSQVYHHVYVFFGLSPDDVFVFIGLSLSLTLSLT